MSSIIEDYQGILGLIGGLIGIAVAIATYFRGVIQQNSKIHAMELQINTIETRFNVFWTVVERELPKVLLRHHTPEIDAYLRKMRQGELTDEEKVEMIDLMTDYINKNIDKDATEDDSGLKLGYTLLIGRFKSELAVKEQQAERQRYEEYNKYQSRRSGGEKGGFFDRWFNK